MPQDSPVRRSDLKIAKKLMARNGISIDELARRLKKQGVEVSKQAVWLLFTKPPKNPRKPTLRQLSEALGMPVEIFTYAGGDVSDINAVITALLAMPKRSDTFDEAAWDNRFHEAQWRIQLTPFAFHIPAPSGQRQCIQTTFLHALTVFAACQHFSGSITRQEENKYLRVCSVGVVEEIILSYACIRFEPISHPSQHTNEADTKKYAQIIEAACNELSSIVAKLGELEAQSA